MHENTINLVEWHFFTADTEYSLDPLLFLNSIDLDYKSRVIGQKIFSIRKIYGPTMLYFDLMLHTALEIGF